MISAELHSWIKERGISHSQAAELLGITVNQLRKMLYGVRLVDPRTERMIALMPPTWRSTGASAAVDSTSGGRAVSGKTRPEPRIISDGEHIPFVWRTEEYGRAEFTFCMVFRDDGTLERVHVTPKQQPDATETYVIPMHGHSVFTVQSWASLDDPKIWMHLWCSDHGGPAFHCYVPTGSAYFETSCGGVYFGR